MKQLSLSAVLCFLASTLFGQITLPWTAPATPGGTWILSLGQTQSYRLSVELGPGPAVKGEVWANDERLEKFVADESSQRRKVAIPPVFLDAGTVSLTIREKKGTTPLPLISLTVAPGLRIHTDPIRSIPMDPEATPEAKRLLAFLVEESGKHIVSGQQDTTWDERVDMVKRVKNITGKEPALVGFDFLNYNSDADGGAGLHQTEEALAWDRRGGIVAFCWHWRVGSQRQFYSNRTDFRIPAAENKAGWASIDRDIDVVAAELKVLQKAGVPVLWRPLHEASGAWFWWGASGADAYKILWNHLYERLVKVHAIHNLLWVWNGQNEDWYPGDDTVDIVGWDIYGNDKEYSAFPDTWLQAQSIPIAQAKLVALSENGPIPDPELLVSQKVPWSWFMTWNDGNRRNPVDDYFSGKKYMDDEFKARVYNSPYVLTLDELPAWK